MYSMSMKKTLTKIHVRKAENLNKKGEVVCLWIKSLKIIKIPMHLKLMHLNNSNCSES